MNIIQIKYALVGIALAFSTFAQKDSVGTDILGNPLEKDTTILFELTKTVNKEKLSFNYCVACPDKFMLIYKRDTIYRWSNWSKPIEVFRRLDTLNWKDIFVLEIYQGDGCPVQYQILAFKKENGYFLSEPIGNCDGDLKITFTYPKMLIHFKGDPKYNNTFPDFRLKDMKYEFDGEKYKLSEIIKSKKK